MLKSTLFKTFVFSFCCALPFTAVYGMEDQAVLEEAKSIRSYLLEEIPDPRCAVKLFKLFYDHREVLNRVKGKNVFKFMTSDLPKDIYTLGEPIKYLKMYTYWYGKAGEKTKFPQKERQTVKHLIEQAGSDKAKRFVKDYIDYSLFDETKENS